MQFVYHTGAWAVGGGMLKEGGNNREKGVRRKEEEEKFLNSGEVLGRVIQWLLFFV